MAEHKRVMDQHGELLSEVIDKHGDKAALRQAITRPQAGAPLLTDWFGQEAWGEVLGGIIDSGVDPSAGTLASRLILDLTGTQKYFSSTPNPAGVSVYGHLGLTAFARSRELVGSHRYTSRLYTCEKEPLV